MHTFLLSWISKCHEAWKRLILAFERYKVPVTVAVALLLVFLVTNPVHAQSLDSAKLWLLARIADLGAIIIQFLTTCILFLVDILIQFASYNGFGDAAPVRVGWGLVRDVTNMFFIVVLLISAFATIVGYDTGSFHYTKVLPKLLLMAVLVNFSKTFIGLLIDFSQVIMLTFVNAFSQAAGGNFIQALGLATITRSANQSIAAGGTPSSGYDTIIGVLLSYLLGVIMLLSSMAVIGMMIAYLIVRIVGLWLLLIFSPLALFATAVPARIAKGLSSMTNKYWDRLSSLLTGGPVMAFLLWLALATVQQSAGVTSSAPTNPTTGVTATATGVGPFLGLFNAAQSSSRDVAGFGSAAANAGSLASFIVALAMLGIAVETATSVASTVGGAAGKFITTGGRAIGAAPITAAALALRGTRAAGGAAAEAIDRRVDITGRVGRGLQRVPVVGTLARPALRRMETRNVGLAAKEAKASLEGIENLPPERQREEYQIAINQGKGALATRGQQQAAAIAIGKMGELEGKTARKATTDNLTARFQASGMSEAEAKKLAGTQAELAGDQARYGRLKEQKDMYDKMGQAAEADKVGDQIKEMTKKNPTLLSGEDFKNKMEELRLDPEAAKGISASSKSQAAVLAGLLNDQDFDRDASGNLTGISEEGRAKFDRKFAKDPRLMENADALDRYLRGSGGTPKASLEKMVFGRDPTGIHLRDNKTGERVLTPAEKQAMAPQLKQKEISDALSNGVSVPDVLTWQGTGAANQIGASIESGTKTIDLDFAESKEKGQRNYEQVSKVLVQFQDPNISNENKNKALASFARGGAVQLITERMPDMSRGQRRDTAKTVRLVVQMAETANDKMNRGQALSADETEIVRLYSQLDNYERTSGKKLPSAVKEAIKVEAKKAAKGE